MGECYSRIHYCAECCCCICCMGGVFHHMWDEGNLTCGIVKDCCEITTTAFVRGMVNG